MKPFTSSSLRRKALLLPALGVLLAPLTARAEAREDPFRESPRSQEVPDRGIGGRAGSIEEFNFGPPGTDVGEQRSDEGSRLLSGRVIELKGQTLYVDRDGVVVPLDVSELRIHKQPEEGQEIIASYDVERTSNVARSLAGEVEP